MRIGYIIGSLSATSINRVLAEEVADLLRPSAEIVEIPVAGLPLYNRDLDDTPPPPVTAFKEQVRTLDGLLLVTPEHNRSISAALKNALEWGSRPYGEGVLNGLPAGILGAAPGALGTVAAQQHLRAILGALDMPTLGQPEAFIRLTDETVDASTRAFVHGWADAFVAHVDLHRQSRAVVAA